MQIETATSELNTVSPLVAGYIYNLQCCWLRIFLCQTNEWKFIVLDMAFCFPDVVVLGVHFLLDGGDGVSPCDQLNGGFAGM